MSRKETLEVQKEVQEKENPPAKGKTPDIDLEERKHKLVFDARIDSWKQSLLNDMRYRSRLLVFLKDKSKREMVHNPSLFYDLQGTVYEEYTDERGYVHFLVRGSRKQRFVKKLPPDVISSKERLDMDFGWTQGRPQEGFYDYYNETLALFQFILECQGFAEQLLGKKNKEVWQWIRSTGRQASQHQDPSIGEIQAATRVSGAVGTAQFGLFLDQFAPRELKDRFASLKNPAAFEKPLALLKNAVVRASPGIDISSSSKEASSRRSCGPRSGDGCR